MTTWTRAGESLDQTPDHSEPIAVTDDEVLVRGLLVTPAGNLSVWPPKGGLAGLDVVDGTVYAAFSTGEWEKRRVHLVRSEDAGRTWVTLTEPVRTP